MPDHLQNRRLYPRPWQTNFLFLSVLRRQIEREAGRALSDRHNASVLDIGCGARPYEPLFEPHVSRYIGLDIASGPRVDIVGEAENLPLDDATFDCVLCSQVLEHSMDPAKVVREANRVLRPGGTALISTHGVIRYHPSPDDYWRWTHAGLARLIVQNGGWSHVRILPNGGTGAALALLLGRELDLAGGRLRISPVMTAVVAALNVAGASADRALRRVFPDKPPDLAPNYLAVATKR